MIEVAVREQHAVEAFESETRLQNLASCALATINEKTIFVLFNDLGGKPASYGWGGGGSTKEDDFEQVLILRN